MFSSYNILSFDYGLLLLITAYTIGLLLYVIKGSEQRHKLFLIMVYFFIYLYSGMGGALKEVDRAYIPYYMGYLLVLSLTLKFFTGSYIINERRESGLSSFIDKHYKAIWIIFLLLGLTKLIIPENHLSYLISPPKADLTTHEFTSTDSDSAIQQIIYLFRAVLIPFFYWSLYKMRRNTLKIGLIMFFDLYVDFCANQYLARNQMLVAAVILFMPYFQRLSPQKKTVFITVSALLLPFVMYFFYGYSIIRQGAGWDEMQGIDMGFAIQTLLHQEISYPQYFEYYFGAPESMYVSYFIWLILLPLPGFLKFGAGTMPLNRLFSTIVTGLDPGDLGFSVVLPGLVGESVLVFGPYFFFVHAIILGILMKFVMNTLSQVKSFDYIFYYFAIEFSFILGRAGTMGVYPHVAKSFFIFLLIIYFIKPKKYSII